MTIRRKLLILLLTISLVPVVAALILTRVSIDQLSTRISNAIKAKELQDTIEGVTILVHNYREAIMGANNSLNLALEIQAHEVERRLTESSAEPPFELGGDMPFGFDETLPLPAERWRLHHPFSNEINFQYQQVFFPDGAKPETFQDFARLWTMTGIYHELFEANRGTTLWHYTALESGSIATFPARDITNLPDGYDPRLRLWYTLAKESPNGRGSASINLDATTQSLVLTVAKPICYPDSRFAGVTAIDRQMNHFFRALKIPAALEDRAGFYLVGLGLPEEPIGDELVIFWDNHKQQAQSSDDWEQEVELKKLRSTDQQVYSELIADLKSGKDGMSILEYKGKKAMWFYSRRIGRKAALIMIVPYEVVLELAQQTQAALIDTNLRALRDAGLIILAIIVIAAVVSFIRARKFTTPINQLAAAANTLADGDYSAKVDISTGDELQRLAEVFNDLGPKLEEHEKTQRSLALARAIQQNLLPSRAPNLPGFEIAGRCRYCDETGGDYFDFIHLPDPEKQQIGIVLGDVTGHGVGAALLMASARSILRNASQHFTGDVAKLMSQFNDQLSEDTGDDKFMTLFYGVLDDENRSLIWASGGHDPALWYQVNKDAFEELPNTGPLTGYMKDMPYEQAGPVTLEAGDILLVGTDGIWEAEDTNGQPYGKDRLFDMIRKHAVDSAEDMTNNIIESVEQFTAPQPPADDITLIIIKAI